MSSDPAAAAIPAASGPTANVDAEPVQNPGTDLISAPAVSIRPNDVQNRFPRLYLPISIEENLGVHERGGPTAALLTRLNVPLGNNVSAGTTVSRSLATVTPNPRQGPATCGAASTSTASTSAVSIVDTAPYLLPFFNNGPVFGLPGTVEGNFWHRTQLIGDPNCKRTELARRGVFIDLYSTTTGEWVASGGLKTGNSFFQNTQLSINLDTARAGLWPGGLLHF